MISLNGNVIEQGHFPDGTMLIKQSVPVDYSPGRSAVIRWNYEHDSETLALFYLTKHLKAHGVDTIHLDMPYIPNARQDRVKCDEDIFTLKYFAELINSLGFASVSVLDPHSSVSEALIERINIKKPDRYIADVIKKINDEDLLLFYPDEGAMKRYSAYSDKPYAFGIKKRDWATGKINGLDAAGAVELIKGRNVLIIDDICSKGGTFYHSALKLKELGADKIYLYISHCENTIHDGELLTSGLIERVFTTDSLLTKKHDRIEVLDNE